MSYEVSPFSNKAVKANNSSSDELESEYIINVYFILYFNNNT